MNCRPEGWKNRYAAALKELCGVGLESIGGNHFVQLSDLSDVGKQLYQKAMDYEAGADAILKALKKDGTHFGKGEWTDDATFETGSPGTVIFIPDEVK